MAKTKTGKCATCGERLPEYQAVIDQRRQETKTVKAALQAAGIPVRSVRHCTGTAYGWLSIYLDAEWPCRELEQRAIKVAQTVTGRRGDYDGKISTYLR